MTQKDYRDFYFREYKFNLGNGTTAKAEIKRHYRDGLQRHGVIKAEGFKVVNSKDQVVFNSKLPDVQIFTENGTSLTWTKPEAATQVYIEVIGGGGTDDTVATRGGGGGGGGALARGIYSADALPATLTITIGAGGSGGASGLPASDGSAGEASNVTGNGFILQAYGGGSGAGASNANRGSGGGGGGTDGGGGLGGTGGTGGRGEVRIFSW